MKTIILGFFALLLTNLCWSQSGTLDPGFGNGGFILTQPELPFQKGQAFAKQCFVRADGKIDIVVLGNKTQITRRLSNGQLDVSYAYKGYSQVVSMITTCAALQQDGKIVAGGSTNGSSDFMVARFQVNGNLDSSFGDEGVKIIQVGTGFQFLNSIAISNTGKIVVGGFRQTGNISEFVLAQFTPFGILDASFGTAGITTSSFNGSIASLAIQADGKIIAAGSVFASSRDFALARYNSDGTLDLSLNGTGFVSTDFGFDDAAESVITDAGKIYVGGFSSDASGFQHFRIARYNNDGSADVSYNGGSVLAVFGDSHDVLISMKLQVDGKMIAAGRTDLFSANYDVALVRINPDGSLDKNFGTAGNGLATADAQADESVYVTIQPDGKILTGGDSDDFSTNTYSFTCFRFDIDGILDLGFGIAGVLEDGVITGYDSYNSLLAQSDGKVTAAKFISNGSTSTNFVNRFKANGTPDSSFGQNGVKQIGSPNASIYFQPDGKMLTMDFSSALPQMFRYNTDGNLDVAFGAGGVVQLINGGFPAFQPDGKIVIGSLTNIVNGKSDFLITRYNANGTLDLGFGNGGSTQFNADTLDNVNSISIGPDGKIMVGGTGYIFPPDFSSFKAEVTVLRLNADGSPDAGFGNGGLVRVFNGDNDFTGSVLPQSDNKILLIYFVDHTNGQEDILMTRLNSNGTIDTGFGQNGQVAPDGFNLVLQPDQKIVTSGSIKNNQNNEEFILSRFNTDGSPDPSFGTNGKTVHSFTGVDNDLFAQSLSGYDLFLGGSGVDKTGAKYSIIAKYLLGPATPISCPADKVVITDNNKCSAKVTGIDPSLAQAGQTVKYKLTGATTGAGNGSASGKIFNKGVTTVSYSLGNDKTKTCSFSITVQDKQAPTITGFSVSPVTLSPPDHKMRDIIVNYTLADNCGISNVHLSVTSNEVVQSNEKGDQSPDWQIPDNHHIKLRAESLAGGNGRIYTITLTVTDASGNQTSSTATVSVPKSNGNPDCNLQVTAAPNPSHNYFLIRINSKCSDKIKVRLLDNLGNVLRTLNNLTAPQVLKLGEGIHPGIYFVEVTQSGNTKSLELVKL